LGIEYNMGKLGGNRPFWYQKAMEAYRKAADGGNCLAMSAIGELYASGSGVRADPAQAQSWQSKAQSCHGGNLAAVQQEVAQYKTKAAAARDPALYTVLVALPNIPNVPAQVPGNVPRPGQARSSIGSGELTRTIGAGLAAALVLVLAAQILNPNPPSDIERDHLDTVMRQLNTTRCFPMSGRSWDQKMAAGC